MNIASSLVQAALETPDRPAVGHGDRVIRTYGEFGACVAQLAGALRGRLALDLGDRVAIIAANSSDYLDLLYAIWHAGLAAVPVNAKLHGAEHAHILENSGARAAFVSPAVGATLAGFAPASLEHLVTIGSSEYAALFVADPLPLAARGPSDLAWLFYTSGTTGRP